MMELRPAMNVTPRMIRLTLSALAIAAALAAQAQPNILLVIADDMGLDPAPGYMPGPQKAVMPNLEALMAAGLSFDNVWANPLCSPTRSTVITGRYGFRTGVLNPGDLSLLPSDEVTLHRYLDDVNSGYATSIIGKWHLGGSSPDPAYPNAMGIPHYAGLLSGAVSNYSNWPLTINGTTNLSSEYITTKLTDLAVDWIGQQTQPWFCWLAYNAPHTPLHLPPLDMHSQGALPTDAASINANPLPYYLAMCESVDHEVGRLLAALPPGEAASTVVIFMGDNGTDIDVIQAPYVQNHAKGTLFEGGVRVPLVIAGPGVTRAGEREEALVNGTDLFTTIVELTGQSLPSYHDSRSLVPMLSQSGLSVRSCLYTDVSQAVIGSAIRNERWKLISLDNGQERFFDLLNDPWEASNLLLLPLGPEAELAYIGLNAECGGMLMASSRVEAPDSDLRLVQAAGGFTVLGSAAGTIALRVLDPLGRTCMTRSGALPLWIETGRLSAGLYRVVAEWPGGRAVLTAVVSGPGH